MLLDTCRVVSDLVQKGRAAEAEFERLLGGVHVKSAIAELSKADKGDESEAVKFSELFYGKHYKIIYLVYKLCTNFKFIGYGLLFYTFPLI